MHLQAKIHDITAHASRGEFEAKDFDTGLFRCITGPPLAGGGQSPQKQPHIIATPLVLQASKMKIRRRRMKPAALLVDSAADWSDREECYESSKQVAASSPPALSSNQQPVSPDMMIPQAVHSHQPSSMITEAAENGTVLVPAT
eukprot:scaffold259112_cov42-Prasinocladus_malaysianus.AAC.2